MSQCHGIFVHKSESNIIIQGSKYLTVSWITPEEIWPKPKNFSAESYNVKPVSPNIIQNVDEGHIIDLGNLQIKVMHLPGHTIGSLGLMTQDGSILATGDTVYATDHELIDWYPPGSSVSDMAKSVERILKLSPTIELALPGHNHVLNREQFIKACEDHLQKCGSKRQIKKILSRGRARTILFANSRIRLPSYMRYWIQQ